MKQLREADLKLMSPEEIVKAQEAGQLDDLLGKPRRDIPRTGQLKEHHLKLMTPEEIVAAEAAGRFDDLLGRKATA
jgi:hypothetical protein